MSGDDKERRSQHTQTPLRTLDGRAWGKVVLLTLFFFAMEQVDLFGLATATEAYSRSLIYQILAPYEPSENRERITVVMLDDRDLVEFGQLWPAEYGFHAVVLQALSEYRPAAVFVDIAFIDERSDPTISELAGMAEHYQAKGIPLLVAGPLNEAPYAQGIRPELAGKVQVVPVPGGRGAHQGITYPLWDVGYPTAAMAIYQALGKRDGSPLAAIVDPGFRAGPATPELEVTWKISDDRESLDSYQRLHCAIHSKDLLTRVLRVMVYELPGIDNDLRNPCPYHTTLTLRALLSGDPRLDSVIRDRVIIYGADLLMAADKVDPPTHTPLAAAHLHAMALNNLLDRGSDYRVNGSSEQATLLADAVTLLCLFLLMATAQYWELLIESQAGAMDDDAEKHTGSRLMRLGGVLLGWSLSCFLIVVAVSYIAYELLALGVSNWTGLLFFTLIRAHARLVEFFNELAIAISRQMKAFGALLWQSIRG